MATPQIYLPGMAIGAGVNTLNGDIKGDGVLRTLPEPEGPNLSQQITFALKKIETSEELEHTLGLSVSAEGRYGMVSGSAQFNFSQERKVNSYSMFVSLSVDVVNSFIRMRDVNIKAQVLPQITDSGTFFDAFGDAFVVGMQTGGQLMCLFEIQARSESEKQEISARLDVKAEGLVASGSVSAELNDKLNKLQTEHSATTTIFRIGGNPASPLPSDPNGAVGYALSFANEVKSFGQPLRVLLQSYRSTDNFPAQASLSVPSDEQLANLMEYLRRRRDAMDLSNQIYYVTSHPEQFPGIEERLPQLQDIENGLAVAIDGMSTDIRVYANKPMHCPAPTWLKPPVQLPVWGDKIYTKWMEFQQPLGAAQGPRVKSADGWKWQDYAGGRIYLSPDGTRVYEVNGDIFLKYRADGCHTGQMGYPVSDELPARSGNYDQQQPELPGRVSRFEGGYILFYARNADFNNNCRLFPHRPGPNNLAPLGPWVL